jgi:hypothetical protein
MKLLKNFKRTVLPIPGHRNILKNILQMESTPIGKYSICNLDEEISNTSF